MYGSQNINYEDKEINKLNQTNGDQDMTLTNNNKAHTGPRESTLSYVVLRVSVTHH
jgi:hypothetical protein